MIHVAQSIWLGYTGLILLFFLYTCPVAAAAQPQSPDKSLAASHRLVRHPKTGETEYFRITRADMVMNAEGKLTARSVSSGVFKREVVYVRDDGVEWLDRYTWQAFFTGQTEGIEDTVKQQEVEALRGFSYDLRSTEMHSVPPIDIGGLAKTPETFAFFTLAWDVATIQLTAIGRPSYPLQNLDRIGERITEAQPYAPAQFDFTPVVSNFTYARQPLSSTFTGLSLIEKSPCAMIQFASSDNTLAYDFTSGAMRIRVTGSEWFTGSVWLSLKDNTIIRAELQGVMITTQTAALPGQLAQYPVVIRQQVKLERISARDFEQN